MERFRDVFDHPHELVVRGGWDHALGHQVANDHCSVAKTEWKHYRGASYVAFWRERFSSGEPRHVIGIGKGEVALDLPRWLGS